MRNPLADDLDRVLAQTGALWDELRGARVFITGGTGFFGCWLLETLALGERPPGTRRLGRRADARSRAAFTTQGAAPGRPSGRDVAARATCGRSTFPDGAFSHVIHAATDVERAGRGARSAADVRHDRRRARGRALEFARALRARRRFLFTSSGAVYGRQPADLTHVPEDYCGGPDPTRRGLGLCAKASEPRRCCARMYARSSAAADDRALLRVRRAVPAARCAFRRRQLHPRRARGRADSRHRRRHALPVVPVRRRSGGLAVDDSAARPADAAVQRRLREADLDRRPGAERLRARFTPEPAVTMPKAAAASRPPERYVPRTARRATELGLTMTVDSRRGAEAHALPGIAPAPAAAFMPPTERTLQHRLTADRPRRAVLRDRRGRHQPQRRSRHCEAARGRGGRGGRRRGEVPEAKAAARPTGRRSSISLATANRACSTSSRC